MLKSNHHQKDIVESVQFIVITSIAVAGIFGIIFFADFDVHQVPTGLIDISSIEKTVSDNFSEKHLNNSNKS